ncbi:integrase, catalytic region, zinc finger, CCHC-type containing protein [Tanacetum coccineum]|uniref:Integrase, catalytic region, zinc finger, CCHC-type containing protein n=1 Tax=Tanacetum coccineum TaxID=301880 RepID=A0ABQ5AJ05_9ASTR
MLTSITYQQSLADVGSKTRHPMLKRGSYIPWESRFRRFINPKRENRKRLNKALDEGPYQFQMFVPSDSTVPKLQTAEDLQGDALLHYDAEIEVMNLILLSIPNDIYNFVVACTSAKDMWKRVKRLMRGTIQNQVDRETHFTNEFDQFVVEPMEALVSVYNRFAQLMNDLEINNMHFLIVTINIKFLNSLQPEWLKYVTQVRLAKSLTVDTFDDLFDYLQNSGNTGRNTRRAYVQEEVVERSNTQNETGNVQRTLQTSSSRNTSTVQCYNCSGKGHYARNDPKPRVRDSKYFMKQMLLAKQDEAGVLLTDKHNDFLFADASRMEEIEELSANICLMARIQPANKTSDARPSYDSAFISEVQSSSIDENKEQMYPTHTKIINSTIGDDQIDSNIIFDEPNGNVNSGSVEKDTHVPDLYALEKLARNAYKEDLEAKLKKNVDLILKLGNSLQGMFMRGPKPLSLYDSQLKHGLGYPNPFTLKQAISQCPKLYLASSLSNSEIPLNVRDTEDTLDDASKNFVPQIELSTEQKYFPSYFIPSDKTLNATSSILGSMPSESPLIIQLDKIKNCFQTLSELIQKNCKRASIFYTSPEEIQLNDFCQDQVKPIVNELQFYFEFFRKLFQRDIKEMKDVFESTESELCEIKKQNDFLKDQLLEASLKHEVEISVLLNHECEDNSLHAEIEQVKKNSIKIQEGLQEKIKILEKDV